MHPSVAAGPAREEATDQHFGNRETQRTETTTKGQLDLLLPTGNHFGAHISHSCDTAGAGGDISVLSVSAPRRISALTSARSAPESETSVCSIP